MAVENLFGSQVMTGLANTTPPVIASVSQAGGRVRYYTETVEMTAGASINSTYSLARLPTLATLLPQSKIHFDDLTAAGAPVLDLGLFNVNSNIVDDDNAIIAGVAVAAAGSALLVTDITTFNNRLWEKVAGQTKDPFGQFDIKATLKTAVADLGGTITLELYYTVD